MIIFTDLIRKNYLRNLNLIFCGKNILINNFKSKRLLRKEKITFQDTTILINLKDQEYFSKKLINYLNSQNIKIKILIADGGKKKQNIIF